MQTIKLWKKSEIPFASKTELKEKHEITDHSNHLYNVIEPDLTIFPAENPKAAVMVMPGGGYELLAIDSEGYQVGKYLSARGITVGVLKYRLPLSEISSQPWYLPICDAQKGLQELRQWVKHINSNPEIPIGVMGFSAGAHLAAWLTLVEQNNKPIDFSSLIYGVNSIDDYVIEWLTDKLYHRKMIQIEKNKFDFKTIAKNQTNLPPFFLVHAKDDDIVPYSESFNFSEALKEMKVKHKYIEFATGGHGFGLGRKSDGTSRWPDEFIKWIDNI